jgi:hypothetical protein
MIVPMTMLIWVMPPASAPGRKSRASRRHPRPDHPEIEPRSPRRPDNDAELDEAADESRPGEDEPGAFGFRVSGGEHQHQGDDEDDVEKRRRERRRGKIAARVERTGKQRHQRGQHQIGKRDPREHDREVELGGVVRESRRQRIHQQRHCDFGERDQHQQDRQQGAQRLGAEPSRRFDPAFFERAPEQRYESRVERTLGEQPPE